MQLADVADLRTTWVGALDAQRVGHHLLHDAADLIGLGEDRDRVVGALAHLALTVRAQDHRSVAEDRLRLGEDRSVSAVEGPHDLAAELQVRRLVLADRHAGGLVDGDIGRLEDRVVEQPHAVLDAVLTLLLIGGCPFRPRDRHDRVEDPGELRVLGQVRLTDEGALLRVEAHRQQVEHHLVGELAQERAVVDGRQGVEVDDGVDRVELVLKRHVVDLRSKVIAQVRGAGGLNPAQDALAGGRLGRRPIECNPKVGLLEGWTPQVPLAA